MKYTLRPYQQKAVDSWLKDMKAWIPSVIVAPAWSGKSLIIAWLIDWLEWNTIVFQPSKEILEQNYEKFVTRYWYEWVEIFSASLWSKEIGKVTFATIWSIKNANFDFSYFDNVIIDEAHSVSAKEWMYKDFLKKCWTKRIIWLTATPYRLFSTMAWSECRILTRTKPRIFQKFSHVIQMEEMYRNWFLAKLEYFTIKWFDSSKIKLNSNWSEYKEEDVQRYFREIKFDNSLLDVVKRLVNKERKWILVFVPSIEDWEILQRQLGNISRVVSCYMKKEEREEVISDFRAWIVKVVINVNSLTTWFDYPELDTVVLARPTRSISLYVQMLWRWTRPHKDKQSTRIVDMCDNVRRMGKVENYEFVDPGWEKRFLYNGQEKLTWVILSDITR